MILINIVLVDTGVWFLIAPLTLAVLTDLRHLIGPAIKSEQGWRDAKIRETRIKTSTNYHPEDDSPNTEMQPETSLTVTNAILA